MKTFKGKLYFLLINVVILAFFVILAFLLEDKSPIKTDEGLTIFIITQAVVNLCFVIATGYLAFSKKDISNVAITYTGTLIIQFLPLLVRLFVKGIKPRTILAVIIIFVVMIIYLGIVLSMGILGDKMKKAETELAGREIKVQDIDDYNDEDGKFIGANNKKGQK